ncbi:UNVERIFIED_CONTAM: hypothetical protein FKN15_018822 [Acipenser sinensis]
MSGISGKTLSVANRKAADRGGGQMSLELTPEEQKAVDILGPTALHGVPGGIDVFAGELPTCEVPASTSGQASPQQDFSVQEEYLSQQEPSLQDDVPLGSETPGSEEPATGESGTRERQQGRRKTENSCGCSSELIELEKNKLSILKNINENIEKSIEQQEQHHQEIVALKAKLEILQKQLVFTEAQYHRPTISVPVILPEREGETCADSSDVFLFAAGRGRQPIDIRLSVMAVTRRGLPIESITGAEALVESCGDGEPQKKKRATEQSISSSRGETLGSPVYER